MSQYQLDRYPVPKNTNLGTQQVLASFPPATTNQHVHYLRIHILPGLVRNGKLPRLVDVIVPQDALLAPRARMRPLGADHRGVGLLPELWRREGVHGKAVVGASALPPSSAGHDAAGGFAVLVVPVRDAGAAENAGPEGSQDGDRDAHDRDG